MNRRDFMRLLGVGGSGLVLPGSMSHVLAGESAKPDWHLGFQNPRAEELHTPALKLAGRLPEELEGTFYRNGPARHELGDRRYSHWFDGDGMIHAFRLGGGRISHHARFVETPKYRHETCAGEFQRRAFGTVFPDAEPVAGPDAINVANTSVVPFDDRLLALWEGGSAWELDPHTLATGERVTWSDELEGAPFSAHPSLDTDGTLWNFGVVPGDGALVLYEVAPSGALRRAEVVSLDASPMVHDFAITRRHLVFLLPPFRLDPERFGAGESFIDSHRWYGDDPMRVLIIDKSDWSRRRWFDLPAGLHFHVGNAWEDGSGVIRFDYTRYDNADFVTRAARGLMRGEDVPCAGGHTALVRLDTRKGHIEQEILPEETEFPRVDPRRTGQRYQQLYTTLRTDAAAHPLANGLLRRDLERGTTDAYVFGANVIAEEHVFVPGKGGEGDGWLIGTALDLDRQVSLISVFRAGALSQGPVAQGALPYPVPLGFHGNWKGA